MRYSKRSSTDRVILRFCLYLIVLLTCLQISACKQINTDCSPADAQCDGFRIWLAYQTVTPLILVGDNLGVVHVSADGINWQSALVDAGFVITDIIWANGNFWVTTNHTTGTGAIFYSPDGLQWQSTSNGYTSPRGTGIAFGNGRFVATTVVVGTNTAFFSSDGINWTANTDPVISSVDFAGTGDQMSFTNGLFLGAEGTAGLMMFSTDGLAWTQGLGSASVPTHPSSINGSYFWVDSGTVRASRILTGGTPPAVSGLAGMNAATGNNRSVGVIVGDGGAIHTSTDAFNWSGNRSPGGSVNLFTVTVEDPRLLLAGGLSGGYYLSKDGGSTWEGPLTIPGASNLTASATRPGYPFL